MSWLDHNGWPMDSIRLLAKAKRLKKRLDGSMHAKVNDTPEIATMEKRLSEMRTEMLEFSDRLQSLVDKERSKHRKSLGHIQREIEELTNKAKELKQEVPERINKFIAYICHGIDHSAGFQIVWWNKRFVILRLPGRKYWSGRGMTSYAKARTKLYDLWRFKPQNALGALESERACTVKSVDGRLSAKALKEWKDEADYTVA